MKNIFRLSFLLAFGLFVLASCTKRPPENTTPATVTSSMTGTFGGTAWTASTITDNIDTGTGILSLIGTSSNNSFVTISVPKTIAAATYTQSSGIFTVEYYYNASNYYYLTTGNLVISSNANSVISGTFSGTFTDPGNPNTLAVTNASFTVKYK